MKKAYSILLMFVATILALPVQAQRQSTYIRPAIVQYVDPTIIVQNGVRYKVYWTNPNKATNPQNNYVKDIYIVPVNYDPKRTESAEEVPPRLIKIRLHECGNNNDFVEAIVKEKTTEQRWIEYGIRLPDDVANRMEDLVKERTKFRVVEGAPLDRIFWGVNMDYTTSPELMPVRGRK